jgi:hypothetical protein
VNGLEVGMARWPMGLLNGMALHLNRVFGSQMDQMMFCYTKK